VDRRRTGPPSKGCSLTSQREYLEKVFGSPLFLFLGVLSCVFVVTRMLRSGPILLIMSLLIVTVVFASGFRAHAQTFAHMGLRVRAVLRFGMPLVSLVFVLPFFSDPYSQELLLSGLGIEGNSSSLGAPVLVPLVVGALVFGAAWGAVLLLPCLSLAFGYKEGVLSRSEAIGLSLSTTDWFLPWLVLFTLIATFSILRVIDVVSARDCSSPERVRTQISALAFFSIALMGSSYFYSGVKKLFLGENLLSWIANNPTQYIVGHSQSVGLVPLYGEISSPLWQATLAVLAAPGVVVALNAVTVLTQIGAPGVFFHPMIRSILIFMLEIEHLAIFFLTGIFFYKWISVMLLLGVLLHGEKLTKNFEIRKDIAKFLALGAIVLGAAPLLQMPMLAWWESPLLLRIERNVGILQSGAVVSIPPSLALHHSLTLVQSRDVPHVDFIPYELQESKSLGGVRSWRASLLADQVCEQAFTLNPPDVLREEHVTKVSRAIVKGLQSWPYEKDVSRAFWFPHHAWTGVRSLAPFKSVPLSGLGSIEEWLVVSCLDEELNATDKLRVSIID